MSCVDDAGPQPNDSTASSTTHESFAHWCAAHPGADASLRVSGQLVHTLVVDPLLKLKDVAAIRRYALQQFTHYHGASAEDWPLAVWRDGAGALVCGLHDTDVQAMLAHAEQHGVRVREFMPVWCAGLAIASVSYPDFGLDGRHAMMLAEGNTATWLVVEDGAVVSVVQRHADSARGADVVALLETLVAETPPLIEPPILLGHGVESPCELSTSQARLLCDLTETGVLPDLMRIRKWGRS